MIAVWMADIVASRPASDVATASTRFRSRSLDRMLSGSYLPFAIQLRVTPDTQRALAGSLPFIGAMRPIDGAAAAYVCRDFTCREPVTTIDALQQELGTTA